MPYDQKYGKITTEHGNLSADEPVFIVRPRDAAAMDVLGAYLSRCVKLGSPLSHLHMVLDKVEEFRKWRADYPDKIHVPDSKRPGGMADV